MSEIHMCLRRRSLPASRCGGLPGVARAGLRACLAAAAPTGGGLTKAHVPHRDL